MPVSEYTTSKEAVRDRARIKRLNQKQATDQVIRERQASEASRQATASQRSSLRQSDVETAARSRVETQQEVASNRRGQRVENAAIFGAANSSIGQSVRLIVALFFIMILLYIAVKNGSNFGGLMGSIGTFISGLSSNTPLFTKDKLTTSGNLGNASITGITTQTGNSTTTTTQTSSTTSKAVNLGSTAF
jgi:hypothetical protein